MNRWDRMKSVNRFALIRSAMILGVVIFAVGCKRVDAPGIVVYPQDVIITITEGDFVEFDIDIEAGTADLETLRIQLKPEGGVTSTLLDSTLTGESARFIYVFDSAGEEANQVISFTVFDRDGETSSTARRIVIEGGEPLDESTGLTLYSNYATENANAFHIAELQGLFTVSNPPDSLVDLIIVDPEDDGNMVASISSLSGILFARNNAFDYANATEALIEQSYSSSTPEQLISNLEVDDILLTEYGVDEDRYAAIKIINIQDDAGNENDRIVFNLKK